MTDPASLLARMDGEPMLWYDRFLRYAKMGPQRSLHGAVRAEEATRSPNKPKDYIPGAWKDACTKWQWKTRAEAWDMQQIADENAAEEELRKLKRQQRRKIHEAYIQLLSRGMQKPADPERAKKYTTDWTPHAITTGVQMISGELRTEYNDVPATKHEVTGKDGQPLLDSTSVHDELLSKLNSIAARLGTAHPDSKPE